MTDFRGVGGVSRVSAEDRRQDFVRATIRVIAEDGVEGATTRRIAEEAGAPLASLHYCFSSKADLFAAVYESIRLQVAQKVTPAFEARPGLAATTTIIFRTVMEDFRRNLDIGIATIALTAAWVQRNHSDLGKVSYERIFADLSEALELGRKEDENPAVIARIIPFLVAVTDGYTLQWYTFGSTRDRLADIDAGEAALRAFIAAELEDLR